MGNSKRFLAWATDDCEMGTIYKEKGFPFTKKTELIALKKAVAAAYKLRKNKSWEFGVNYQEGLMANWTVAVNGGMELCATCYLPRDVHKYICSEAPPRKPHECIYDKSCSDFTERNN